MAPPSTVSRDGEGGDELRFHGEGDASDDDDDDDMETLRRVRVLAGMEAESTQNPTSSAPAASTLSAANSESEDDEELVRATLRRCGVPPLSLKPITSIPPRPMSDGEEDDYELLAAITNRFACYNLIDTSTNRRVNDVKEHPQVGAPSITSEKETSSNLLFVTETNSCEGCPDSEDACNATQGLELNDKRFLDGRPSGFPDWQQPATDMPLRYSSFPKLAQVFFDAVKKNRSCQKLLRSKLIQIESKLEANRKLRERVKILKDFQASLKRTTSRALSQKKDPFVQLITVPKVKASKSSTSKVKDKKADAMYYGPSENSHVSNYRMALTIYPISLSREKWSEEESKNLEKGIKQQFQEMSFKMSLDFCSGHEGSLEYSIDFDAIMTSIADYEITPEHMRLFLPKVNWKQLASMYVPGRSGAECEARWLNWENPLINQDNWTKIEDKNLLHIVKERGFHNWVHTASLLGTNRTAFQCLARFQRSLNTLILKREWTDDEDAQLRKAVETFGEGNWQLVASSLEGRTGPQCSNRWYKSLHPMKKGRWTSIEDKCLKVAVMILGPKTWNKIAHFVPDRTQVQCRERWVNSLDPSLNWDKWTEEEDRRLLEAILEFGACWARVAKCVPPRTDNQCRRRWRWLCPHQFRLHQEANKIKRAALPANFVDRESERPTLGPKDFLLSLSLPENQESPAKPQKQNLGKRKSKENITVSRRNAPKVRSKKPRGAQKCSSGDVVAQTICDQERASVGEPKSRNKRVTRLQSKKNRGIGETHDPLLRSGSTSVMGEIVVEGGPSNIDATGKKRAPRARLSNDNHTQAGAISMDEVVGSNNFREAQKSSDELVVQTVCDQALVPAGEPESGMERVTKLLSSTNRDTGTHDPLLCSGSTVTGEIVVEVGLSNRDATRTTRAPKAHSSKNNHAQAGIIGEAEVRSTKFSETQKSSDEVVAQTVCDQALVPAGEPKSRKSRVRKLQLKTNRGRGETHDPLLCSGSTSVTGEIVVKGGPNNRDAPRKRRAASARTRSSNNNHAQAGTLSMDEVGSKNSPEAQKRSDDVLQTICDQTLVSAAEPKSRKKRVTKLQSTMNRGMGETHDPVLCSCSTSVTGEDVIKACQLNRDATRKKRAPRPCLSKDNSAQADTIGEDGFSFEIADDDMTLASFQKIKRRRCK